MRLLGVTAAHVSPKGAVGTNFRLAIPPAKVEETGTGKSSNLLQNVRFMSSVRTKGMSAPQRSTLDNRVSSIVTVRSVHIFNFPVVRITSSSLDSCLGPDNFKELRDTTGRGLNVNGSICLNFVCQYVFIAPSTRPTYHIFRYANVTAGSTCEIENTGYIAYGPKGEFVYVVSRSECDSSCPPILRFTIFPQR